MHNDSAPCHTSLLENNQIPTITQPPYSPDLTLQLLALPELKMGLSSHWFVYMEEMQQNATASHTRTGLLEVLPAMAELLEQVYIYVKFSN
jgi:hypothetical protein